MKKVVKKFLAGMLAVCVTAAGIMTNSSLVHVQAAETDPLLLYYDFSKTDGKTVIDSSGNGNDGTIKGNGAAVSGNVLTLPGGAYGSGAAYVELPTGMFDDRNELTISLWLKNETGAGLYSAMYFGDTNHTNYWLLNPWNTWGGGYRSTFTHVNDAGKWIETYVDTKKNSNSEWHLYTTVISGADKKLTAYYDGAACGSVALNSTVSEFTKQLVAYIGKSSWPDIFYKGGVKELRVYTDAFSDSEVQELYAESKILDDINNIEIPAYALADITLPTVGANHGSAFRWTSSNSRALTIDGNKAKIGTIESDEVVKLTVTGTDAAGKTASKAFDVTVLGGGAKGILNYHIENFDLGITYITEDITMPAATEGVEKISWASSNAGVLSADGKVNRPANDTKVTLTGTFSSGKTSVKKDIVVTVAGKTVGYLATYIAAYEYNIGVEYAEFPSLEYTDNNRTDVMYYGLRTEHAKDYTALNNNKPVLYPLGMVKIGSPSLFRKADGTYGVIAAVDNTTDQIFLADSTDLIFYENEKTVTLNADGIIVKNPSVTYDNGERMYSIYWEGGDGKSYVTKTADFKDFSAQEEVSYKKAAIDAELPVYAAEEEASSFALTRTEYDRISKKFGEIKSIAVNTKDQTVKPGESITLPEKVEVEYSDGSTAEKGVDWDVASSGLDLKNPKEGTYTISGTVKNTTYNSPVANYRADPYIVFNEEDGYYYMTGSNMDIIPEKNNYQSLVLRRAKTINGLTNPEKGGEEVEIFRSRGNASTGDYPLVTGWFWAPELHYIGGQWRMIAMATVTDSAGTNGSWRQCIFTCTDSKDMLNAKKWEYTGYIGKSTDGQSLGSFDTTYFEYNGQSYYITPARTNIYITTVDPSDLTTPTGPLVQIAESNRAFECNVGAGKQAFGYDTYQSVEEGGSVLVHDGKIFIAYAGSTVDMHYCVCLLYADLEDDLMNPDSWHKYPYPLLNTADLTTTIKDTVHLDGAGMYSGTFGPGHNSFSIDEDGNPVIVYHARAWEDSYDTDRVMFELEGSEGSAEHNADIVNSTSGDANIKKTATKYRAANAGGSFSYDMKVENTDGKYTYVVTKFMKEDNGKKVRITADGTEIANFTLTNSNDEVYSKGFEIPKSVMDNAVNGKIRITVESVDGEEGPRLVSGIFITTTLYKNCVGSGKYGLSDPGRHAYVNSVHFGADGFPIFNMTSEQILSSDLKNVTMTVTVSNNPPAEETDDNKNNAENNNAGNAGNTGNTNTGNTDTDKTDADAQTDTLAEGKVYPSGDYNYKITSLTKKTVSVVNAVQKSKTITIKDTVAINGETFKITAIEKNAFKGNSKATSAKIGKNVTIIGVNAFNGCKKLKKVSINSKVLTKIGDKAFYNCKKLNSMKIESSKLKTVGKQAFRGTAKKLKMDVPNKKAKNYRKMLQKAGLAKTADVK